MKNKKGIFFSLVKNYIFLILISLALCVAIFLLMLYRLNFSFDESDLKFLPSQIVKSDYRKIDSKQIESLNGWIEILDEDNKVIYVKGKKLDNMWKYSYEELLYLTSPRVTETIDVVSLKITKGIVVFAQPFKGEDCKKYICLVKYPENMLEVGITVKKFPEDIKNIISHNMKIFGALFLLLFILNILIFSKLTSRKIGRPLADITEGIRKMSEGNYDVKLDFKAEKEFVLIRDAFNLMIEKLNRSEEEKVKLEQKKNLMLVDLSHDIKTPITTIQNYSLALSDGLIENEEKQLRYYNTIYQKSLRVNELVDDLFELTKLESMDYKLNISKLDFVEFIRRIISEHYDEIMEKGFELEISLPEYEIYLDFDERLVARAISNIIVNAVKYNPRGTKLRIGLKNINEKLILEIADNGIGIPDSIRDSIFEIFVSGDKSRRSSSGTGLGLSISKKIFEKHNWDLVLLDPRDGKTTIFLITIDGRKYHS